MNTASEAASSIEEIVEVYKKPVKDETDKRGTIDEMYKRGFKCCEWDKGYLLYREKAFLESVGSMAEISNRRATPLLKKAKSRW